MRRLLAALGWLGILALVGCENEAITVYQVIQCDNGCKVITSDGTTVTRRLVTAVPSRYTALTATQDVMVETVGMVQSLPRDQKYVCRVLTPRDWECTRPRTAPGSFERLAMKEGSLSVVVVPLEPNFLITVGRCHWNHIGWRNRWGLEDPRGLGGAFLGFVAGCVLPPA